MQGTEPADRMTASDMSKPHCSKRSHLWSSCGGKDREFSLSQASTAGSPMNSRINLSQVPNMDHPWKILRIWLITLGLFLHGGGFISTAMKYTSPTILPFLPAGSQLALGPQAGAVDYLNYSLGHCPLTASHSVSDQTMGPTV